MLFTEEGKKIERIRNWVKSLAHKNDEMNPFMIDSMVDVNEIISRFKYFQIIFELYAVLKKQNTDLNTESKRRIWISSIIVEMV